MIPGSTWVVLAHRKFRVLRVLTTCRSLGGTVVQSYLETAYRWSLTSVGQLCKGLWPPGLYDFFDASQFFLSWPAHMLDMVSFFTYGECKFTLLLKVKFIEYDSVRISVLGSCSGVAPEIINFCYQTNVPFSNPFHMRSARSTWWRGPPVIMVVLA